jgi:hypothetical protein
LYCLGLPSHREATRAARAYVPKLVPIISCHILSLQGMSSLRICGQELRVSAARAPHVPLHMGSSLYTLIQRLPQKAGITWKASGATHFFVMPVRRPATRRCASESDRRRPGPNRSAASTRTCLKLATEDLRAGRKREGAHRGRAKPATVDRRSTPWHKNGARCASPKRHFSIPLYYRFLKSLSKAKAARSNGVPASLSATFDLLTLVFSAFSDQSIDVLLDFLNFPPRLPETSEVGRRIVFHPD